MRQGSAHAMTGLLGHATSFAKRKLHLGYRAARLLSDMSLGRQRRDRARPRIPLRVADVAGNDEPFAELRDGEGRRLGNAGGRRGRVTGTFFHAIATTDAA